VNCKLCGQNAKLHDTAKLLQKFEVKYYFCEACQFLQTEDPYWLEEAYNSAINRSDTGILARNIALSKISTALILRNYNSKGSFLDYAGGYGIFTRLMRDIGFNFYWSDHHARNLICGGFEFNEENAPSVELTTAFECLEHFVDPYLEIGKLVAQGGDILVTTLLLPSPPPKPTQWWYFGLDHGQHVSFYSKHALRKIAARFDYTLLTNGINIHLFTRKGVKQAAFEKCLKVNELQFFLMKRRLQSLTESDYLEVQKQNSGSDAAPSKQG
jgi:hypothetical protein